MSAVGGRAQQLSKSALRKKRGLKVCETWNIVRGDTVMIITGKDKGLTGTVTKVCTGGSPSRPVECQFALNQEAAHRPPHSPDCVLPH